MEKITAVVLAAGAGKRMHSDVHKQYMMLAGRPVLFYALQAFAESAVTDIVVVVGAGEIDYCRKEIIEKYHIQKVCAVVEGGRERYHSVYEGLKAADGSDYVLIHDGARPLVTTDIISRSIACVRGGFLRSGNAGQGHDQSGRSGWFCKRDAQAEQPVADPDPADVSIRTDPGGV